MYREMADAQATTTAKQCYTIRRQRDKRSCEQEGYNGCNVIAYDLSQDKVDLANKLGITAFNNGSQDPVAFIKDKTNGIGADGVVITASANTDQIISDAANMCRIRGRVVLVGVIGLNLNRSDFYTKEITFQVSCS